MKIFFSFTWQQLQLTPEINLTLLGFCDCHVFVAQSIVRPSAWEQVATDGSHGRIENKNSI
jgi:hypothetical protein